MENLLTLNKRNAKSIHYNGILIGLFLSADMIIKLVLTLVYVENFLVFFYLSIFLVGVIVNGFRLNNKYLLIYIAIAALFGISLITVNDNYYTFQYFLFFTAFYLASGILQFQVSVNNIFKTISIVNVAFVLYLYFVIFDSFSRGTLDIDFTLNLSYTSLIGISAFFLSFSLKNYKQSKLFFIICSISVLTELFFMLFISSNRGSLIGLTALFSLILLKKISQPAIRIFVMFFFATIGIYIYNNLIDIVRSLYNITIKYDLPSNFLHKSLWKLEFQDFSSGRFDLYNDALLAFSKSPFLGTGIGDFSSKHAGQYPHNLFLDVLTELGFWAFVIVLIFSIYGFYIILKVRNSDYATLAFMLFVLAFPKLMFSSTLWMSPFFWAFLVLILVNPRLKDINSTKKTDE
ncbi:O-antigen ligase family protein [Cytobacillus sp. NCCP-133]|uniref:O-antigen ligase family protein n=1 Tax=Cytobacillus sp. NCCP-133 TaxID=766848 RepID=UPI00222EA0FC|nr:O-antigen ligase family protein [Cytobacillus sp. NCCP-133]GLB61750.1 O-antigen polymerase [Cytobacillus sp. NCCP-133]